MYFFFFFPVGTDSKSRFPPVGTALLLATMLGLYSLRYFAPGVYLDLIHRSFIPANPQWSAAFLSLFLHGGWPHLLGNALYIWIFGRQLEGRLGFAPLALIFAIGGVLSCWVQAWFTPPQYATTPLIGARILDRAITSLAA